MPNLDYSGYDFNTALAQLEAKLGALDSWKDTVNSATGQVLLRLIAYLIDMDGYKIDRRAEELYPGFARLRSSLVQLAGITGYEPRRKVSALTTLRFSTSSPPVAIAKGTVVATSGGVRFVTTQQGTITGAYVDLTGKQGDPGYLEFTSDGSVNQKFTIPTTGDDVDAVENTSLVVEVGGTEWTKVSSFVDQTPTAQVYTVTLKSSSLQIEFGDGVNGKIPSSGTTVRIEWLESLGLAGNVSTVGAINTVVTTGLTGVSVTNTEVASGGEEEEGIEEIRTNFPQVFVTGDRAVTKADFKALLLAYSGVLKAEVYAEQDVLTGVSNPDYAWRIELVIVPSGGGTLTRAQEEAIEAYLELKKLICTRLTFQDPTYIPVDFTIRAVCGDAYSEATVQAAIESALDALVNLTSVDLGESLRYSDVVSVIDAVTGVTYHLTEVFLSKDAGTGAGAKVTFASTDSGVGVIPVTPIDRGNVLVFIETVATSVRRRVGYDDGSGSFTSSALVESPRVSSGTINYSTGAFSITFDAAVTSDYKVIVQYQTGTQGSKVVGVGDAIETTFVAVLERFLSPDYVEIYKEGILVGSDDGSGNIVDAGGGDITAGSVNYATGDVSVQFASPPASQHEITSEFYYENQDIEVSLSQLLQMGVKDVTVKAVSS